MLVFAGFLLIVAGVKNVSFFDAVKGDWTKRPAA